MEDDGNIPGKERDADIEYTDQGDEDDGGDRDSEAGYEQHDHVHDEEEDDLKAGGHVSALTIVSLQKKRLRGLQLHGRNAGDPDESSLCGYSMGSVWVAVTSYVLGAMVQAFGVATDRVLYI